MPSYADLMAKRNPTPSRGPVRLWISKGEVRKDSKGREYVEEIWQEEEVMDTDLITMSEEDSGNSSMLLTNDKNGLARDKSFHQGCPAFNLKNVLQKHAHQQPLSSLKHCFGPKFGYVANLRS